MPGIRYTNQRVTETIDNADNVPHEGLAIPRQFQTNETGNGGQQALAANRRVHENGNTAPFITLATTARYNVTNTAAATEQQNDPVARVDAENNEYDDMVQFFERDAKDKKDLEELERKDREQLRTIVTGLKILVSGMLANLKNKHAEELQCFDDILSITNSLYDIITFEESKIKE